MRFPATPLRHVVQINPESLDEAAPHDYEFPYVDIANVVHNKGVVGVRHMTFREAPSRARRVVRSGDVIVSTVRTYLRASARIQPLLDGAVCSTGFAVLRPNDIDSAFLAYVVDTPTFVQEVGARSTGVSYPAISPRELARIEVPAPGCSMQRRIADFLDDHCGRVAATAQASARTLNALSEQRGQLFERLVGETPGVPLRHRLMGIDQGWSPECEATLAQPGEWGVLKVGCVNHGRFRALEHKRLPGGLMPRPELEVRPGDIVVSRANTRELVGSAAMVEDVMGRRLMLCDKTYRLRLRDDMDGEFIVLAFASRLVRDQIEIATAGASSSMQNISQETIRSLVVPDLPHELQVEIAQRVRKRQEAVDRATVGLEQLTTRLAEYRDALVTEAVTGQLDVTKVSEAEMDERTHAAAEGAASASGTPATAAR